MMVKPQRLSNNKKRKVKELVEQATQAFKAQRFDVYEQLCRKIVSIQPGNADVSSLRGIRASEEGRHDDAEVLFVQAVNAAPKRVAFRNNLGQLYLKLHMYADAAEIYGQALVVDKESLEATLGYCNAQIKLRKSSDIVGGLEKVMQQRPHDTAVLMTLFHVYHSLDRFVDAKVCLQNILARKPNHAEAHFQMAQLALESGALDESEAEIRAAIEHDPSHVNAYGVLAGIRKFDSPDDPDIAMLENMYQSSADDSDERAALAVAMGKIMDDLKQYDRAFVYVREANEILHHRSHYSADAELAHMQAIMQAYSPASFAQTSELDDASPVFIVGMPRCGSTLVEQILVSHPQVASRGEWGFFEENIYLHNRSEEALTLENMLTYSRQQWVEIGEGYLQRLCEAFPDARRVIDKTLTNIRLIGAIHCAIPNAKIIHVRRSPLDTCLSIYKNNLLGQGFQYGSNLGELGYYYRMYQRLMQHWREVLPEGVMYELDYEQLVGNQETETRQLLDACGLEWHESCLQFNRAGNMVQTASQVQVRKTMYKDSVAAWKRYEKHLQPLIRILGTG